MEESSDAHMETDVSSTTDDVPESQEVTASQGHVEMVIVVENVDEDDNSSMDVDEPPSKEDDDTKVVPTVAEPSQSQNTVKSSPVKSEVSIQSVQSPAKPDTPHKTPEKSSPIKLPMVNSVTIDQPHTVDSSTRELIRPSMIEKVIEKSPIKNAEIHKSMPVTPVKETKVIEKTPSKIEKSPTKVGEKILIKFGEKSPIKFSEKGQIKVAETSPIKLVLKTPTKVTEKSPTKEDRTVDKVAEKSPVKDTEKTDIKVSDKSPIKIILPLNKSITQTATPNKEPVNISISVNGESTDLKDTTEKLASTSNNSEMEPANDSQLPTDVSEKEHNKSISRELRSLINSAKESKIISECTQLTSKTRKSRVNLDSANTSLNASAEPDKIEGSRRGSNNSQVSNSSEKSERIAKRSMRSQNPEFVSKCKQFLNSVTGKAEDPEEEEGKKPEKPEQTSPQQSPPKKKKIEEITMPEKMMGKLRTDQYCWRCHYVVDHEPNEKAHPPVICTVCPRSFHYKCLSSAERKMTPEKNWVCPDCLQILLAESSESRSPAMKKISLGMLCELLKHALERLMELNGVEPFLQPVDRTLFPDYDKYVVHPMDLSQMKQNIVDGHYGSTEAFTADTQWILHNSIIFNTCEQPNLQSKLTGGARSLVRSCRAEMGEIEACPECYAAAHARRTTWFTDVCSTPHILLWAKLKGFPYWPAKGMTVNSSGLVDVRFFGAHDRAWVPAKDCFLYSEKDPNNFRSKRQDILDSMQEAEEHIRNISRKYGQFVYQPFKTVFDPSKLYEQLKIMIPSFEGEVRPVCIKEKASSASPVVGKDKKRSSSKSSKSSTNDGETSECDDSHSSAARVSVIEVKDKSIVQDESASDTKSKPPEVEATPKSKEAGIPTRKRRRSNLEEAVLTIMGTAEKRKKTPDSDNNDNEDKKDNEVAELSKNAGPKSKIKEAEPSSENKETLRVTPIKLVALPRSNKQTPKLFTTTKVTPKPSPKQEDKTQQKVKITRADKSLDKSLEKFKTEKRRNSRNRSVNATSTPKTDKNEKESEPSTSKEKAKDNKKGNSSDPEKTPKNASDTAKPTNKKINFDDDTSLAVIARETRNNSGLPTISSVRSLSTTAQNTVTTNTKTNINTNTTESQSRTNVFTPTSTDNIRSMKEAEAKLQRLRDTEIHPTVGRVGVRAFARMTSPARNDNVSVEIKGEPVDLDEVDEERRIEKMDLMNACKLRPVNQQQNLRDVRINKVVVTPTVIVKKPAGKTAEVRPRAKKSFPQGKNAEGRSELTCKNSMVYIPIQPPATQAPRGPRPSAPVNITVSNNAPRLAGPGNNANINSVTSPLRPSLSTPPTSATSTATSTMSNNQGPTVGQVPTTVHTVPLMTSVNGQWMFSLQPVMSVGCVDNASSPAPPIVNGVQDRASVTPSILPINNTLTVTPQSRTINDVSTPGEPPRLQHRPILMNPLDASTPIGIMPTPSTAGSLTAKLNQSAVKMTDFFRNLLEECIEKLDEPVAQVTQVKLRLEQTKWRHQQEVEEIRHNHELMLTEMRLSFEKEKIRAVNEARRMAQIELDSAVKLAKSKQWCANCSQEAQFYCCWNTSYCDYPCQRAHWAAHYSHCTQRKKKDDKGDKLEGDQSPRTSIQTDNLPALQKSVQTPSVSVSAKNVGTRVYADTNAASKTSIIVKMVDDNAGNQTMKCVGTYKSPSQTQVQQPLLINKQMMADENTSKKVVTSGGYLIVGAGNNTALITPSTAGGRRPNNIQYFT